MKFFIYPSLFCGSTFLMFASRNFLNLHPELHESLSQFQSLTFSFIGTVYTIIAWNIGWHSLTILWSVCYIHREIIKYFTFWVNCTRIYFHTLSLIFIFTLQCSNESDVGNDQAGGSSTISSGEITDCDIADNYGEGIVFPFPLFSLAVRVSSKWHDLCWFMWRVWWFIRLKKTCPAKRVWFSVDGEYCIFQRMFFVIFNYSDIHLYCFFGNW